MLKIRPQDKTTVPMPLQVPQSIHERLLHFAGSLNSSDADYVVIQMLDQELPQIQKDLNGNGVKRGRKSAA